MPWTTSCLWRTQSLKKPTRPIETREEALRVIEEADRRAKSIAKIDYEQLCFPEQLAFIEDESKLVAAICSRRSGKTEATALKMLRTALRIPHSQTLYVTLSRPSAKRNMWPKLLKWDRLLSLGAKFNHAELTMTLRNGSTIMLGGANDESEIERYRGTAYPLVVLDEVQAFRPYIESLIHEVLLPATFDYKGQIIIIGTPNPSCHGYFFDATTGIRPGWNTHRWTILDNPHVPDAGQQLEDLLKVTGYTHTDPKIRREFYAEWVRDSEGLVYDLGRPLTIIESLPEAEDWSFVLGVDIGYVDASAFVTLAYSTRLSKVVVVDSHQKNELIPSAIAVEIERLSSRYDYEAIVIDPGGGGKLIVEELKQRYGVPAEVADKKAKQAAIENLNGDIRAGVFHVISTNHDLIHDASLLQWDYTKVRKRDGHWGGMTPKDLLEVDDRTPDHLLDAMLYGYRRCKQYLYDPELEASKPGTPEWFAEEEARILANVEARLKAQDDLPWWEDPTQSE